MINKYDLLSWLPLVLFLLVFAIWIIVEDSDSLITIIIGIIIVVLLFRWVEHWNKKSYEYNKEKHKEESYY